MNDLDIAKEMFGQNSVSQGSSHTTTVYGIATTDSINGRVMVDLCGDTINDDDIFDEDEPEEEPENEEEVSDETENPSDDPIVDEPENDDASEEEEEEFDDDDVTIEGIEDTEEDDEDEEEIDVSPFADEEASQSIEVETTFRVKEGDQVIVSLVGADGTGKKPTVIGVVGRGDETQEEIDSVKNYFWYDDYGAHVTLEPGSVEGKNVLLDSDSLDIREGASNSEADQTVYASFGREVTVGSRKPNTTVGLYSQVFGYNCEASGEYSHAEGSNSKASGDYSHAEGSGTATGSHSHAEGNSGASGQYAHAEGENCSASGDYSHAEGRLTNVIGQFGHGEGFSTYCNSWSHTEGYRCQDYGACNHLEGLFTRTAIDCRYQHIQGIANVVDTSSLGHTYLDIIGNGEVSNADYAPVDVVKRSNAYNLDRAGNAEFQGEVYVGGCTPNGETPYPVVRFNTSLLRSEYFHGNSWLEVPNSGGGGSDPTVLLNTVINVSDWAASSTPIDSRFHYEAVISVPGTTSNNLPEVVFSIPAAASGIFAPLAQTDTDSVIIYASKIPESSITIPSIVIY